MEWNLKWFVCVERDVACLHSPHSHTFNSHSPLISSLQTKHIRDTDQCWLKVIKHFIAISSRAATSLLSISPIHLSSFPLAAAHLTNCPNNQIWVLKFTNHNWKQLQSVSCDSCINRERESNAWKENILIRNQNRIEWRCIRCQKQRKYEENTFSYNLKVKDSLQKQLWDDFICYQIVKYSEYLVV